MSDNATLSDQASAGEGRDWIFQLAGSVALTTYLLWFPLFMFASGVSIVGRFEESVGYRYFYSLRRAFGHEYPWLPQGDLMGFYHVGIQYLLSLLGFPQEQLFPRIDVFCFVAVIFPAVAAGIAFYFASQRFTLTSSFVLLAVTVVLLSSTQLPDNWTAVPDYYVWVVAVVFLCLALIGRSWDDTSRVPPDVILGAMAGTIGAIKITYLLFPLAVVAVRLLGPSHRRWTVLPIGAAVVLGFCCFVLVMLASYGFNNAAIMSAVKDFSIFFATQSNTLSRRFSMWPDILLNGHNALVAALPTMLLVLGVVRQRNDVVAIGLLGFVSLYFAMQRFYDWTLIEVYSFGILECGVLLAILDRTGVWIRYRSLRSAVAAVPFIAAVQGVLFRVEAAPEYLREAGRAADASGPWVERLEQGQELWMLTSDNAHRPYSILSALCKGGMDIMRPAWGASPYVAALYPHFRCAVVPYAVDDADRQQISRSTVVFAHQLGETLGSSIARVEEAFAIDLSTRRCDEIASHYSFNVTCPPT